MLGLSLVAGGLRKEKSKSNADDRRAGPRFLELVPWFILGFLLMATLRSAGVLPTAWVRPLAKIAAVLTTVSMAALGLGVDVRIVAEAGMRVTLAVTISLIVLGLLSFTLIFALGVA